MPSSISPLQRTSWVVAGLALVFAVVWQSHSLYVVEGLASYLPLHMFAETFSIVVSMMVFGVAWNVYSAERPGNIIILACALLAIGLMDFAHMLSFKGMPDFITPSGPEKAINLWLAARLVTASVLLTIALREWQPLHHPRNRYLLLACSLVLSAVVIWLGLAYPQDWPRTFIAGQGLTPFKIGAEYTIIAILLVPAVRFYRQARRSQPYDAASLFAATAITILSELCFTLYSDVADIFNLLGHAYKIVAYIYIYRAVFKGSVREPYQKLDSEFAENRRIAKDLRAASLYTRSLIEANLDPLVAISMEGKITDVNHATEAATGTSRSELIGTDFCDYFTEPDKAREGYRQVFEHGYVTDYPLALRGIDGSVRDVLYNASVYRDEAGNVLGVLAAARDITERKKAEQELAQLSQQNRLILDAAGEGIYGLDIDGKCTFANPVALQLLGLRAAELVGRQSHELFHYKKPDGSPYPEEECPVHLAHKRGAPYHGTDLYWRKDGNSFPVEFITTPMWNAGKITGAVVVFDDITERRQAELKLRESEQAFRMLAENSPDVIVRYDREGRRIYVNPEFERVNHLTAQQVYGKKPSELSTALKPMAPEFTEKLLAAMESGVVTKVDLSWPVGDKEMCWFVRIVPEFDAARKVVSALTIWSDITERKRTEKELLEKENHSQSLLRLSRSLERAQTDAEVLNAAQEEVKKIIGYRNVWVYLLSDDGKYFIAQVAEGAQSGAVMLEDHAAKLAVEGDRMLEEIAASKEIVVVEDARTDERVNKAIAAQMGNRTIVNVPIVLFERHMGTVGMGTFGEEGVRVPSASEREYLTALASHMAAALDRIHLMNERIKADEALREREAFLASIIENIPDMIFTKDARELRFTRFNRAGEELLGYSREDMLGKSDYDFFSREQADFFTKKDRQVLASGQLYDIPEEPINTRNGARILHTKKIPIMDSDGKPAFLLGISEDITERKQAEQVVRQSEEALKVAQRIAHLGNWHMDLATNEVYWSEELYRMYGFDSSLPPPPYDESMKLFVPESWERLSSSIARAVETGAPYELELELIPKEGGTRWMLARGELVRDEQGKPVMVRGVAMDITTRKRAEQEIRTLNQELEQRVAERTEQLEAANKELESFSYSVSHDLRTPLRAIDGFSHILLDDYADKLDDEGKRLLNVVRDNTGRMGQLIDDILQFSRTGRLELVFSEIDMERLAREAAEELKPAIAAGSKLQLEIAALPRAQGDRAMMHQVFVNLLSNAIKFSRTRETPAIRVGASVKPEETIYYVQDNGVGFDMQYSNKLFGVFQRLHSMNEFEGTGIGLAIVKRIITRHGGRVWAEGKVNEGAALYFALPNRGNGNG
jgi:PAS domain S-box-containing protein